MATGPKGSMELPADHAGRPYSGRMRVTQADIIDGKQYIHLQDVINSKIHLDAVLTDPQDFLFLGSEHDIRAEVQRQIKNRAN